LPRFGGDAQGVRHRRGSSFASSRRVDRVAGAPRGGKLGGQGAAIRGFRVQLTSPVPPFAPLRMSHTPPHHSTSDDSAANLPVVLHARVVVGAGGGPEKTILNSPRFLTALGYRGVCAYMRPPNDEEFEVLVDRAAEW